MNARVTIYVPKGKAYVLIVPKEPVTHDMTVEYLPEAKRLGQQLVRPRFLVDARGVPDVRDTFEKYEIHRLTELFGFRGDKIAVITDPGDRSYDFTDTVSNNAGHRHRLFTDEQEAISWLEQP